MRLCPPYDSGPSFTPRGRSKDEPERDVQMRRILRERDVEAAVKGGAVFAAGGGGWADHGRMLGTAAVNAGEPELVSMDEIADEAWIATAAAIGAPGGYDAMADARRRLHQGGGACCRSELGRTGLRFDDRPERQVEHAERLAAVPPFSAPRWSMRSATSARIRPATWARSGSASSPEPTIQIRGRRQPRQQRLYRAGRARRHRAKFRRSCARPPTCRAASSRRAAIPVRASYVKAERRARRHLDARSRLARRSSPRSAKAARAVDRRDLHRRRTARSSARARSRARRCTYTRRGLRHRHDHASRAASRELVLHVMNEYMAVEDASGSAPRDLSRMSSPRSTATGRRSASGEIKEGMTLFDLRISPRT